MAALVLVGGIFTFQGLLFNFLPVYAELTPPSLPSFVAGHGAEHFFFQYSPIFAGWQQLFSPSNYDIFWFQHPATVRNGFLLLGVLLSLAGLFCFWFRFICQQASVESGSESKAFMNTIIIRSVSKLRPILHSLTPGRLAIGLLALGAFLRLLSTGEP